MPSDRVALKLVDVARRLHRRHQEMVPDIFDRDLDTEVGGKWKDLSYFILRSTVRVVVGDLLIHHGGHQKNGASTICLGIAQGLLKSLSTGFTNSRPRIRQRTLPVGGAANTCGPKSTGLQRVE